MKTTSLHSYLFAALVLAGTQISAQTNKGFAVTGETKGNVAWMVIREIDFSTGAEVRKIYSPEDKFIVRDAVTGNRLQVFDRTKPLKDQLTTMDHNGIANTTLTYADGSKAEVVTAPTETFVAASAYDAKNDRIFYTPMRSNELRYFDLKTGVNAVYYVRDAALKSFPQAEGEADVITRMCFAADGFGYAMTNDGNHLIRFTSGEKITISDLGSVQDGKNNKDISLRTMNTGWGGDLIADAYGNLYSISMKGNVFKINPQTMVGDYIGMIKNLPDDYTVNGAAVDADGKVIISCAAKTDHYYSVDFTTLEAVILKRQEENVFNASDLASAHLLYASEAMAREIPSLGKGNISLYPNPVTNRALNITFDAFNAGNQTVQLVDGSGHTLLSKVVNVSGKTISQIILPKSLTSGMYILKVVDSNGKEQYSRKVVVH